MRQRIRELGGVVADWDEQATVKIPGNGRVATVSAPIGKVLGWLAPLGATADDERVGVSVTWMGLATAAAIELVMQGRHLPQLVQQKRRRKDPAVPDHGSFRIR
ncbi:MAG: hypothetical protein R2695_21270 [Acidimicrobiales bacterium]